jgi:hypothetical protein
MPRSELDCPKAYWRQEAKTTVALFFENPSRVTLSVAVIGCCRYLFESRQEYLPPSTSRRQDFESFLKSISFVINSFE